MKHASFPPTRDDTRQKAKAPYSAPVLRALGKLHRATHGSGGNGNDGAGDMTKMSDRRVKERIVRIGNHPLGIGLYLFDYRAGFRDEWGHGRQFGVMADEVETVMPDAVSVHADGFKVVDYSRLGIDRAPR